MTLGLLALLLLSGFAAGLFGSVLGLGGGIFVVPILVLAAGVPMHSAVATSLLCVVATSSAAASENIARGFANVRIGVRLEMWTVAGAVLGGSIAGRLAGSALIALFGFALFAIAALMWRGDGGPDDPIVPDPTPGDLPPDRLEGSFVDPASGAEFRYWPRRLGLVMGISSVAGVLSGLLGIGGGLLKVPALVRLSGFPMKAAAATSNFMIGVTGVGSALIYYSRGDVLPLVTAATVLGVFGGSRTGSAIAGRLDPVHTRRIFAAVLVLIAAQMMLKAVGWWPA